MTLHHSSIFSLSFFYRRLHHNAYRKIFFHQKATFKYSTYRLYQSISVEYLSKRKSVKEIIMAKTLSEMRVMFFLFLTDCVPVSSGSKWQDDNSVYLAYDNHSTITALHSHQQWRDCLSVLSVYRQRLFFRIMLNVSSIILWNVLKFTMRDSNRKKGVTFGNSIP